MAKLTKKAVEALEAPAMGQAFLWDGELKGFGVRVTKAGAETTLGRVQQLILAAESTRIPLMRLIDQYAAWYTPTILMLAGIVLFLSSGAVLLVWRGHLRRLDEIGEARRELRNEAEELRRLLKR